MNGPDGTYPVAGDAAAGRPTYRTSRLRDEDSSPPPEDEEEDDEYDDDVSSYRSSRTAVLTLGCTKVQKPMFLGSSWHHTSSASGYRPRRSDASRSYERHVLRL